MVGLDGLAVRAVFDVCSQNFQSVGDAILHAGAGIVQHLEEDGRGSGAFAQRFIWPVELFE